MCTYKWGVSNKNKHVNVLLPLAVVGIAPLLMYGLATISRLFKITGLFCQKALLKRRYSAKKTRNFMEPNNRSHPIQVYTYNHLQRMGACERWGAGVEYHFQEFNEPYASS